MCELKAELDGIWTEYKPYRVGESREESGIGVRRFFGRPRAILELGQELFALRGDDMKWQHKRYGAASRACVGQCSYVE